MRVFRRARLQPAEITPAEFINDTPPFSSLTLAQAIALGDAMHARDNGVAAAQPVPAASAVATIDVPAELLRVLEAVTSMCDHVISYIEADRTERTMLIEAITQLARSIDARPVVVTAEAALSPITVVAASEERLLGGSVDAGPEPETIIDLRDSALAEEELELESTIDEVAAIVPETEAAIIDLRDPQTAVEVRCRFGDRWVDGFEICEVLDGTTSLKYRLRRRVDGVVLPELFDAADIRHVETFQELLSTPAQQRHWSPL